MSSSESNIEQSGIDILDSKDTTEITEEKKRIAFRIIKEIKAPILIQYYVSEQEPFYC